MGLILDTHDELTIYQSLRQLVPLETKNLNPDLPDLYWIDEQARTRGISLKQVTEVLSSIDDVEEQLSRDYMHVDMIDLIVWGVIIPEDDNWCTVLEWTPTGRPKSAGQHRSRGSDGDGSLYRFNYSGWVAKMDAFNRDYGITIWTPPTHKALIQTIAKIYKRSMEADEEHDTFKRIIRAKVNIQTPNPYVRSIMSLYDAEDGKAYSRTFIGEDRASRLIKAFGTPSAVFNAHEKEIALVPGIGPVTARKIRKAIGL